MNTSSEMTANFEYKKQDDSELDFKKGDTLVIMQQDPSGWWYGHIKNQPDICGFFPSTFVGDTNPLVTAPQPTVVAATTPVVVVATTPAPPAPTPTTTTTTTPAPTSHGKSLPPPPVKKQQQQQQTTTTSAPAPAPVVKQAVAAPTSNGFPYRAKVLYAYDADGKDELTIKVNEEVDVFDAKSGWSFVKRVTNKDETGWVPEDYIQRAK